MQHDPNSVLGRIEVARKPFNDWVTRAEKIIDIYRAKRGGDDYDSSDSGNSFNSLYSNIAALQPALFTRAPSAVASRRHRDRDAIGRVAAEIITRAVNQEIERNGMQRAMEQVVLDVLLVGRGVPWVRYEADKRKDGTYTNQRTAIDHVNFRDFAHSPARTWADVERNGWVARRVTLSRAEGRERFGGDFAHVALTLRDRGGKPSESGGGELKYAEVWEMWRKSDRKQIFAARGAKGTEGNPDVLEMRDDPYGLMGFFPCPRPAFATLTSEDLIPAPDYEQYRKQAEELDRISVRIEKLTGMLKLVGFYDSSVANLTELLESQDGTMLPVDNLSDIQVGTPGKLDGVARFIPVSEIAGVLLNLYEARNQAKQVLDEISGVSDLVRGAGDPREKATSAKIKSNFITSRLEHRRRQLEECTRDVVRIQTEMQVELFPEDMLREQSGYDLLDEVQGLRVQYEQQVQEHQQAATAYQQAMAQPPRPGPDGQPPQPPQPPGPPPEDPVEQLWGEVTKLVRDDKMRSIRVDIESGTTTEQSDIHSKTERSEMLTAVGDFIANVVPAAQAMPELAPITADLLSYVMRTYRVGRSLESSVEEFAQKLRQQAQEAAQQPPPEEQPPPVDEHNQALAGRVQQQAQIDAQAAGPEIQKKQAEAAKAQAEATRAQAEGAKAAAGARKAGAEAAVAEQQAVTPPPIQGV